MLISIDKFLLMYSAGMNKSANVSNLLASSLLPQGWTYYSETLNSSLIIQPVSTQGMDVSTLLKTPLPCAYIILQDSDGNIYYKVNVTNSYFKLPSPLNKIDPFNMHGLEDKWKYTLLGAGIFLLLLFSFLLIFLLKKLEVY
jgi:hypothetical protein